MSRRLFVLAQPFLISCSLLSFSLVAVSCASPHRARRPAAHLGGVASVDQAMTAKSPPLTPAVAPIPGSVGQLAFAFDDATLSAAAQTQLRHVADTLLEDAALEISIEGHCDELGTSAYNLALGERRARAAQRYLVAMGVQKRRVKVISFGEEMPSNERGDVAAHAENRRGELTFFRRAEKSAAAEPSYMRFVMTWNS